MSFQDCHSVSPQCPVEATTYGYYPNLPGNIVLCVVFGICFVAQLAFSIYGRLWTWLACLTIGCLLEMLGYIGRILLHDNPWNRDADKLQIIAIIIGPSFTSAGIDLILKYVVLYFSTEASPLPAKLYTWVFIGVDLLSIVVQAAGGGIAAAAGTDEHLLSIGNHVIVTGIALQVAQLAALGVMSLVYAFNLWRMKIKTTATGKVKWFLIMVALAYVCVLTRCIYRIPELAGGWGRGLQRNEVDFLILDGAMIALANVALTIAHPAFFFPQMARSKRRAADAEKAAASAEESS